MPAHLARWLVPALVLALLVATSDTGSSALCFANPLNEQPLPLLC